MERIQSNSKRKFRSLIADAGYASEENFTYLEEHGQNAYIKPQLYEVSKTRKYKNDKYRPEHMEYDKEADEYPNISPSDHSIGGHTCIHYSSICFPR